MTRHGIKAAGGIIAFLTALYLLNPTHGSLLKLLEISAILFLTLLAFIFTKNLGVRLRYGVTLLVAVISVMLIRYALREEPAPPRQIFVLLMLLLLAIISPYLLKLVRFESKQELSGKDLLKVVLLAVIITLYVAVITVVSHWF